MTLKTARISARILVSPCYSNENNIAKIVIADDFSRLTSLGQ
jgi:hypothetical protein